MLFRTQREKDTIQDILDSADALRVEAAQERERRIAAERVIAAADSALDDMSMFSRSSTRLARHRFARQAIAAYSALYQEGTEA